MIVHQNLVRNSAQRKAQKQHVARIFYPLSRESCFVGPTLIGLTHQFFHPLIEPIVLSSKLFLICGYAVMLDQCLPLQHFPIRKRIKSILSRLIAPLVKKWGPFLKSASD